MVPNLYFRAGHFFLFDEVPAIKSTQLSGNWKKNRPVGPARLSYGGIGPGRQVR